MYCKHCGKQISDDAKFCDGCGAATSTVATSQSVVKEKKKKNRHPILGTIVLIFGIFIIIGALTGGNESEPQKVGDSLSVTEETKQAEDKVFSVGDVVSLNDINVTLVSVTENNGGNYMTPSDGKVFIVCEFEIENNSDKDIAVSSIMSFEAYIDDYSTTMNLSAMLSTEKSQLDGSVAAGKKMNGVIGYEADPDWTNIEIRFVPDFWTGKDIVFSAEKS